MSASATLVRIWALLLALTALLAVLSRMGPWPALFGLLTITPFKAWLVFWHFMHMKDEGPLLRTILAVALATPAVYVALLFADAAFR